MITIRKTTTPDGTRYAMTHRGDEYAVTVGPNGATWSTQRVPDAVRVTLLDSMTPSEFATATTPPVL